MKFVIVAICSLLFVQAKAASISVDPFVITLDVEKGYRLRGNIELACRYEKFVLGDSAEYETFYGPKKQFLIEYEDQGEFNKVTITSPESLYFEYNMPFKYGKECRASYRVYFESENYALGYGNEPLAPVSFSLWEGIYDYQEGDQVYDLRKVRRFLDGTVYTFPERLTQHSLIVRIFQDGREAETSPWVERAVLNPQTGRPYEPQLQEN